MIRVVYTDLTSVTPEVQKVSVLQHIDEDELDWLLRAEAAGWINILHMNEQPRNIRGMAEC